MVVVPDLTDDRSSSIVAAFSCICGIVPWATAAQIWNCTACLGQRALHVSQRHLRLIAGRDPGACEPFECRVTHVVFDHGVVELNHVLVLDVLGTITWHVESRVACSMLAELVRPKVLVACALVDPVSAHPFEKIETSKVLNELINAGAIVWWHDSPIAKTIGGIGRWSGVVLAVKVAILRVGAIAKVWPKSVYRPSIGWNELALRLAASVRLPKLCLEH